MSHVGGRRAIVQTIHHGGAICQKDWEGIARRVDGVRRSIFSVNRWQGGVSFFLVKLVMEGRLEFLLVVGPVRGRGMM